MCPTLGPAVGTASRCLFSGFPKVASCIGTLSLGVGDPAAAYFGSKVGRAVCIALDALGLLLLPACPPPPPHFPKPLSFCKFGSIRIFGKKTLEGTAAFFLSSFLASLTYVQLHYALPPAQAAILAGAGSLVGAVAELYCTWVDDNLFVRKSWPPFSKHAPLPRPCVRIKRVD